MPLASARWHQSCSCLASCSPVAVERLHSAASSSRIEYVPWKQPDVELRIPNIDKARELLAYRPRVDLEEGLLRTVYWYRR